MSVGSSADTGIIIGCETLLSVARWPGFTAGRCMDCRQPVTFGRGHHARCWWVRLRPRVATRAQVQALLRGWRLLEGCLS